MNNPEQVDINALYEDPGSVLITPPQVADLGAALQPLLPERDITSRHAAARGWLIGVLDQLRTWPITLATTSRALDLPDLWLRSCAGRHTGEAPLLRSAEVVSLTTRLAPWFESADFGDLDMHVRVSCVRWWITRLLDRLRAEPVALATGARELVPSALLRSLVEDEARDWRIQLRGGI